MQASLCHQNPAAVVLQGTPLPSLRHLRTLVVFHFGLVTLYCDFLVCMSQSLISEHLEGGGCILCFSASSAFSLESDTWQMFYNNFLSE